MSDKKNGKSKKLNGAERPTDDLTDVALPSSAYSDPDSTFSIAETLRGKTILVTGATGFLGKVYVSFLLRYHPDIEQLYLLVRARRNQTAEDRFYEEIADSPCLDPLREIYGPSGLNEFLRDKVTVLTGDIAQENLGLPKKEAKAVSRNLDLFVNSAGLTNFNPNLENALEINTLSSNYILDFIKLGGSRAKLFHVSTAFVAGWETGPTPEIIPTSDVYPAWDEIQAPLDVNREVEDCLAMIEHAKVLSHDQERATQFLRDAREDLKRDNRSPDDEKALNDAIEDERWKWIKKHLSQEGRKRANHWGWVNIYTYTKSLGERLIVENCDGIEYSLFRPAIIESAEAFPSPGWNEGMNTSAPICYLVYKGHRFIPCKDEVRLDIIPIDHVVGGMIAMGAAMLHSKHHNVYHCGSSHLNPITMKRVVELTSLGARQVIDKEVGRSSVEKLIFKSLDAVTVNQKTFQRQSLPGFGRAAKALGGLIDQVPTRELGGLGKAMRQVRKQANRIEKLTATGEKIFEIFMPFIHDNNYKFMCGNIVELRESIAPVERKRYGCYIEDLNWREYWLDVHTPGLAKWVYPNLEAKLKADPREAYTFKDLVELFDASTANYADNVAFQHHKHGIAERYTYRELGEYADRGAAMLKGLGIGQGHTVLLAGENRPQWGMSYFAILKTSAVAVPIDHESNPEQIANLIQSCDASAVVVSEMVFERISEELQQLIEDRQMPTRIVTFPQLFTLALPAPEEMQPIDAQPQEALNDVASLIYTSGTTGDPKGVMLSHQNFTSMLSSLDGTFRVSDRDGFLSVLPLHHTFEFSAGFLMPISKGATVTYLEELNGDELRSAMAATKITSLIGVPALWQLLHRSIKQRLDASGPAAKFMFKNMVALNKNLRERAGINAGPVLFGAVHRAFGNQIKYMISGGASLPADVLEAFYGMGFDMYEGYGLTEAAPVLTVNRPSDGLKPGSVGRAIPNVEVDIKDPDENGIGEIVARGPNVMLGYLNREEDTDKTLKDGWLQTGDIGFIDKRGRLTIVGRQKEVIVTAGGKNAYPDELEDLYGKAPHVLEIAIVGLPDGNGSERVAALVHPDVPAEAADSDYADIRNEIREWIRVEGQRVPAHNRIQVLRFWDEDLPRTATRKVKRKEVVQILERLLDAESAESGDQSHAHGWLESAVANLSGLPVKKINANSNFTDDLGFDSLMFVELASVLENRGYHTAPEQLSACETVADVQAMIDGSATALVTTSKPKYKSERVNEIPVHPSISKFGKRTLHQAQMKAYGDLFNVEVYGAANIPHHNPNCIVVANHASHLDMGLVKYALGDFGQDIRALAAADYFFSNTARKTYFKHFTNLIPVERAGTPDVALKGAVDALQRGETLLMFPEGTRSKDGKLREFRRGLGYLVSSQKVNILPVYVEGTHRALPKGQPLPSPTARNLKVRIGKPIDAFQLLRDAGDLDGRELYDFVSTAAYDAVKDLRDAYLPKTDANAPGLEPLFEELNDKFETNQVDQKVSYYFSLGQIDHQKWTIIVDPDECKIQMGKPSDGHADCVVKTSPELFRKIVKEAYIPSMDEFMDGSIKTNSPDLLMRFQSVFRLQG